MKRLRIPLSSYKNFVNVDILIIRGAAKGGAGGAAAPPDFGRSEGAL